MKFTFTCKKIALNDSIKEYAEKKISKLDRYFPCLLYTSWGCPRTFDQGGHGDPVEGHFGKHFLKGGHDQLLGV